MKAIEAERKKSESAFNNNSVSKNSDSQNPNFSDLHTNNSGVKIPEKIDRKIDKIEENPSQKSSKYVDNI